VGIKARFEGGKDETHYSSLQLYGDDNMSAICRTVGYTAAIAADLVLKGTITRKGVVLPIEKDVYEPCLLALEREGLVFDEKVIVHEDEDDGAVPRREAAVKNAHGMTTTTTIPEHKVWQ